MTSHSLLIWCASINGEGSSRVSLDLITASSSYKSVVCVITVGSILEKSLAQAPLPLHVSIIVLPSVFRWYILQFLIKLFFPIFLFADHILVLDDYPFLIPFRQFLYFHQPNLLFSSSILWKFKSLAFSLLSSLRPTILVQSRHVQKRLASAYRLPLDRIKVTYHVPSL